MGFLLSSDSFSQKPSELFLARVLPIRPAPLYVALADRCCVLDPVSSVTEPPAAADAVGDGRHGSRAGRQQMETEKVGVLQHTHTRTRSASTHAHRQPAASCVFDISCFQWQTLPLFLSGASLCCLFVVTTGGCVVFRWQPCLPPGCETTLPLCC